MASSPRWQLLDTPNPSEKQFAVTVPMDTIAQNPDVMPRIGAEFKTLGVVNYRSLGWIPDAALAADNRFGLYIYSISNAGDGFVQLVYAKNKTTAEINTPFLTYEITEERSWPPVLDCIVFGQETGFPNSQNTVNGAGQLAVITSPRWMVRRGYRDGQQLQTRVLVREFLSPTPWPANRTESDDPQTTEISWDLVGSSGSIRCLHPKITVPSQGGGYRSISAAGQLESSTSTGSASQIFPETNHITWQDYVINDVKRVNGQYHLVEKTYMTPNMLDISKLAS